MSASDLYVYVLLYVFLSSIRVFFFVKKLCRFSPANDGTVYAASSDGTVSCTDLETGISLSLLNLNPGGWEVWLLSLSLSPPLSLSHTHTQAHRTALLCASVVLFLLIYSWILVVQLAH